MEDAILNDDSWNHNINDVLKDGAITAKNTTLIERHFRHVACSFCHYVQKQYNSTELLDIEAYLKLPKFLRLHIQSYDEKRRYCYEVIESVIIEPTTLLMRYVDARRWKSQLRWNVTSNSRAMSGWILVACYQHVLGPANRHDWSRSQ